MRTFARATLGVGLAVSVQLAGAQDAPIPEASASGNADEVSQQPGPESTAPASGTTLSVANETSPAETPAKTAADNPSSSRLVAEIIVTAQKREENVQAVPISIQAFTADALDAQGIRDIQSLPQITPGLTISTQVGYTSTYIRGVGSDAFLLADPSVATYFDGIYQPFPNSLVQDFGAIDRVEVLKGPQGTLFGRNAVGGAINIITRKLSLTDTHAEIQTGYQTYNAYKERAYFSVPVTDTLALSVSGVYNDGRNDIKGTSNGQPLDRLKSAGGRVQARWTPVAWTDFDVTAFLVRNTGPKTSYTPNVHPSQIVGALIPPQDPYAGSENEALFFKNVNREVYGHFSFFTDWFDVKLLGSEQYTYSSFNYDFDSSPLPLALFQIDKVFGDIQTAELQIVSNETSWAADRFKWILGGYFFHSRTGFDPSFLRVASTNLAQGLLFGAQIPSGLQSAIDAAVGNTPIPSGDINFFGLLGTRSFSGFGQATVSLTDQIALTVGARYQNEQRTLIDSSSQLRNNDGSLTPIQSYRYGSTPLFAGLPVPGFGPPLRDVTKSFDPKVSLEYKPDWPWFGPQPLLYVNWQKATKSSTYNTVNIYDPPDLVKPEHITAFEVGAKTEPFDGLMRFNLSAFHYKIKDQQVQFISLLAGGAVTFENAGSVTVDGAEFDSLVRPLPSLDDDLVFTLGSSILYPRYSSYPNGSGFSEANGLFTKGNDYTGNQVVRSPRQTWSAGLLQTIPIALGPIELGANYYYTTRYFYAAQNSAVTEQKHYGLVGVHASLLLQQWNLRATAFGENVFNARYSYSDFQADFGVGEAAAPLAVYGVRLQYDF